MTEDQNQPPRNLRPQAESSLQPIGNYFKLLWRILRNPTQFFTTMPRTGGFTAPLVFAVVTHWIGAALSALWDLSLKKLLSGKFPGEQFQLSYENSDNAQLFANQFKLALNLDTATLEWFWNTGAVLLSPFVTLLSIFTSAAFMYIAAKIFIAPHPQINLDTRPAPVTFETMLRISSYTSAAFILGVVPAVGTFVAGIYSFVLAIIGIRETFQITSGRALAIWFFPMLLLLALILPIVMLFGIVAGFFALS